MRAVHCQVWVNSDEAGSVLLTVEPAAIDATFSYAAGPALQRMEAGVTSYTQLYLRVGFKVYCLCKIGQIIW